MSKLYFKLLLSLSILAITSACSQDMADQPTNPGSVATQKSHRVSLEDALERSKVFQDGLNGGLGTRGMRLSDIESVEYIGSGIKTRSGDADTTFYLVNYKDEQGFMLLSADERMLPVYAMSDEGRLDLNDTTFNEGLRAFINLAKADALGITNPIDTSQFGGSITIDPFDYKYDRTVRPMFSKNLRSISQSSPFNKYCKQDDGSPAYVGCLPVAVGSILAYFHKPTKLKETIMPWAAIDIDIKNDMFYMLLDSICDKKLLYATREPGSTKAIMDSVPSTLKHFGLQYTKSIAFNDIEAGKALERAPIIIYGQSGPKSAHAWVIDGYIRYGAFHHVSTPPEPGRSYPYFFFHCCWGWGASSNGYYYYGYSGRIDGTADSYDSDDPGTSSHRTYYNMKMNVKL